jgi:hypothetical protein
VPHLVFFISHSLSIPVASLSFFFFFFVFFFFVFVFFFEKEEEEKIQFYVKDFLSSQTELLIGVLTTGFDSIF